MCVLCTKKSQNGSLTHEAFKRCTNKVRTSNIHTRCSQVATKKSEIIINLFEFLFSRTIHFTNELRFLFFCSYSTNSHIIRQISCLFVVVAFVVSQSQMIWFCFLFREIGKIVTNVPNSTELPSRDWTHTQNEIIIWCLCMRAVFSVVSSAELIPGWIWRVFCFKCTQTWKSIHNYLLRCKANDA